MAVEEAVGIKEEQEQIRVAKKMEDIGEMRKSKIRPAMMKRKIQALPIKKDDPTPLVDEVISKATMVEVSRTQEVKALVIIVEKMVILSMNVG